jgi:hypothetical protein
MVQKAKMEAEEARELREVKEASRRRRSSSTKLGTTKRSSRC